MTPEKALAHFKYKLTTIWKPTEFDLEAYNALVEFVNQKQKQQLTDNQLFAKLFIWSYGQLLKYYKSSIFSKIPKSHLHDILKKSTDQHALEFKEQLNDSEVYAVFDMAELPDRSWVHISIFEDYYRSNNKTTEEITILIDDIKNSREEASIRLNELLKSNPKVKEYLEIRKEIFDDEFVQSNLNSMILSCLNHYEK